MNTGFKIGFIILLVGFSLVDGTGAMSRSTRNDEIIFYACYSKENTEENKLCAAVQRYLARNGHVAKPKAVESPDGLVLNFYLEGIGENFISARMSWEQCSEGRCRDKMETEILEVSVMDAGISDKSFDDLVIALIAASNPPLGRQ